MRIPVLSILFAAVAALAACSSEGGYKLPGVYRIDVQQGNVITQEMLDKLKPGMDKNQVRFVMGTPALEDPFHSDRWDYVYSISKGGNRREQRHVAVYFRDDKLSHVDGNVVATANKTRDELKPRTAPVEVELKDHKPGFFSRMFNALPFVGEDEGPKPKQEAEASMDAQDAPQDESGQSTAGSETDSDPGQAGTVEEAPAQEPGEGLPSEEM